MKSLTARVNGYGLRTPAGWWECTLKDVCNGNGGVIQTGPFGSQLHAHDYKETGTPVVMPQQLGDNQISIEGIARISDEDVERLKRHCLRRGDIVFSRRGDVTRRAFITEREKGWLCGTGCMLIRPHHPKLCNEYLAFFFSLHEVKEYITKQAVGATMPNLNTGILEDIPLFLPSFSYQQKAVAILTAYDDLIENNTRRIAILEEMAQAIYREWFVNFRFPGHEKVKLINSPLGKIPEGWNWAKLKDVCDSVNYGYTASANKEVEVGPRFLRITDIVPTTIDWENVPYCEVDEDDAEKYALHEGDIVIARTGATTGYAKRLHKRHPKSVFASYLVRIVPNDAVGKHYIGLIVESDDYKAFIKRNLGGAAQPQANAQVLTSLEVLVPSPDVIAAFDRQIEPMADQKEILQVKNRNLRKTRDLLLPKLISGQLDVEELDIDSGQNAVQARYEEPPELTDDDERIFDEIWNKWGKGV
jgi:type I restriction enzyme, S subunit